MTSTKEVLIPLPYFLYICVKAWEIECQSVVAGSERAKVANLRKHGIPLSVPFEVFICT
jgi:hypothetical protein